MAVAKSVAKKKADAEAELREMFGEEPSGEVEFLIPLRVVPADDMPLVIGEVKDQSGEVLHKGKTHYIQKGKTVEFIPVASFSAMFSTAGLLLGSNTQSARAMVESMNELYKRLSELVGRWTLIGVDGAPLPQPWKNPSVIRGLTEDQLHWILVKLQDGETEEERGND